MKNDNTRTPRQKAFQRYLKIRGLDEAIRDEPGLNEKVELLSDQLANFLNNHHKDVANRHGLSKGMTARDFLRICAAESIVVTNTSRRPGPAPVGYYFTSRRSTYKEIYVEPGLSSREWLLVASHELAHHFLHSDQTPTEAESSHHFATKDMSLTEMFAELEADTFASMLLTGSSSLVEPKRAKDGTKLSGRKIRKAMFGGELNVK